MTRERDRIQENANGYIVKNCPAYQTFYPDTGAEPFTACDALFPSKKCQDHTDCVIKQVIERCVDEINDSDSCDRWSESKAFAKGLLQLFDIEEINK